MTTIEASSRAETRNDHHSRTIWLRLVGKECKQIALLFFMIALLALFGHVVIWMRNSLSTPDLEIHFLPFLLATILLAVGIGPVLVSQEKEQRTLFWLSGLPITARNIVGAKIFVGVFAVLFMWLLSVAMLVPFVPDFVAAGVKAGISRWLLFPAQAYFLLAMSLCTAWIWRSAMTSVLMLVPICTLPVVLTWFFTELELQYSDGVSAVMLLVTTCIVVPVAWYFGRNVFLAPAPSKAFEFGVERSILTRFDRAAPLTSIDARSALIWQFWRQNQFVLLSFLFFSIFGLVLSQWVQNEAQNFVSNVSSSGAMLLLQMNLLFVVLLAVWLSASAFGSDQAYQRIRFLAERGVAPGQVWMTRIVLPSGLLFVMILLVLLVQWVSKVSLPFPLVGGIGFVLLGIVAGASWWGQVSQTRVLSLCGAPIAALLFVGWYQALLDVFGCPVWLVSASMLISFVATRVMTQQWMDGDRTWLYYSKHFAFLVVAWMLPLAETAFVFWSYPGMSRSEYKSNLEAIAKLQPAMHSISISFDRSPFVSQVRLLELGMTGAPDTGEGDAVETNPASQAPNIASDVTTDEAMRQFSEDEQKRKALLALPPLRNIASDAIDLIEATLSNNNGSLRYTRELEFLMAEVWLSEQRLRLEQTEENRERFRKAVKVVDLVATQLRRSDVLVEQCMADSIDADLLGVLKSPFAKEQLQPEFFAETVRRLADREARRLARRRAVLLSWKQGVGQPIQISQNLGGFRVVDSKSLRNVKSLLLNRHRDLVVQKLLNLVDAKSDEATKKAFSDLATVLNRATAHSALWPASNMPGSKWHGTWEQQADDLAQKIGRE